MEEVANEIVEYLYAELRDERNDPALTLVRCFKTPPFGSPDGEQQKFARQMGQGGGIDPQTRCLTLLATRGALPEWNHRRLSRGHVAIPLASERIVENAPMIARLITELGLEIGVVVRPTAESVGDLAQKSYNVLHVPEAEGSPYRPRRISPCPGGVRGASRDSFGPRLRGDAAVRQPLRGDHVLQGAGTTGHCGPVRKCRAARETGDAAV